jgi:hypothetical protein
MSVSIFKILRRIFNSNSFDMGICQRVKWAKNKFNEFNFPFLNLLLYI